MKEEGGGVKESIFANYSCKFLGRSLQVGSPRFQGHRFRFALKRRRGGQERSEKKNYPPPPPIISSGIWTTICFFLLNFVGKINLKTKN